MILPLLILSFYTTVRGQSVAYPSFNSSKYGYGDTPFVTINSIALFNNFLYCTGTIYANDISVFGPTSGKNQVWSTRADYSAVWAWAYTYNRNNGTSFSQVTLKRTSMQIPQNIMLLLSSEGITVLPYTTLNPRETPDKLHPGWTIPLPNVKYMSHLNSNGGVFVVIDNEVKWIPVIQPYSLELPTRVESVIPLETSVATRSLSENTASLSYPTATQTATIGNLDPFTGGILPNDTRAYPQYKVSSFESLQYIWLGHDASTLYILTAENGTTVYSLTMNGPKVVTNPAKLFITGEACRSLIVHPKTFDVYLLANNTILIYTGQGTLKGRITPSFPIVKAMEIDKEGKRIYISGDGSGKGRLDMLDLEHEQLSAAYSLRTSILTAIIITLCILFF